MESQPRDCKVQPSIKMRTMRLCLPLVLCCSLAVSGATSPLSEKVDKALWPTQDLALSPSLGSPDTRVDRVQRSPLRHHGRPHGHRPPPHHRPPHHGHGHLGGGGGGGGNLVHTALAVGAAGAVGFGAGVLANGILG